MVMKASFETAAQAHTGPIITLAVPVPPAAGKVLSVGVTTGLQLAT
jgi:hypothetical protein